MVELSRSLRMDYSTYLQTKVVAAIPCYNTQSNIAQVIEKTKRYVDEVIVIDDGSTDLTADIARASGATVISHGVNQGYGEAIKSCFRAAQNSNADILITIDGDGQHDPDEIIRLLIPLSQDDADLVIGSRFLIMEGKVPLYRKFGISVINFLWNFGSKTKITDTQSGFRAYTREIIEGFNFSAKGMSISIEIVEKARRNGARIREVPITCSYLNNNETLTSKAIKHGLGVALSTVIIRLENAFLNPVFSVLFGCSLILISDTLNLL